MGVWLAFVFGFILRTPIFKHIKDLVEDEDVSLKWYGILPILGILTFIVMAGFVTVGFLAYKDEDWFSNNFTEQYENEKKAGAFNFPQYK